MEAILQASEDQTGTPNLNNLTTTQLTVYNQLINSGWDDSNETLQIVLDNVEADKPRFAVDSLETADWVLKKIAQADAEAREIADLITNEIAAIHARGEQLLKPLMRKKQYFEQAYELQLREWAEVRLDGKKEKSVKTLHGSVGFRKSPDSVDVADEVAAIEWAKSNSANEIIKESISKSACKTLLKGSDFTIPGVTLIPGENMFFIKAELPGG
jgi:phage host-nuclease inhibitor protein Gam